MALIMCPECSREISNKAATCLHCGCPVDKNVLPMVTCPECKHVYPANKSKCTSCYSINSAYIHISVPKSNPYDLMTVYPDTVRCNICSFVYPIELSKCANCSATNDQKPNIKKEDHSKPRMVIDNRKTTTADYQNIPPYDNNKPTPANDQYVHPHDNDEKDTAVVCPKCKARNAYHATGKGFGLGKAA